MKKSPEQNNLEQSLSCLIRADGRKELAGEILWRESPFLMKAAIGATGSGDLAGDFDRITSGQFFLSLDHGPLGIFDTTKTFTKKATYRSALFLGAGITADIVNEGVAIPISKYSVDSAGLAPTKAASIVVTTKEAARSKEGVETLETDLRQAVMQATDVKYLSILATDAATTVSATADPLADLQALLLGVNLSGFGQLFWVLSPAVATILSTWRDATSGQLIFPDLAPKGGVILGCQALVTAALTDTILLIDPSGIVTGSEDLRVDLTENAMFEMDDAPGMDSTTPATATGRLVSMFQTECIGVLGVRTFAAKLVRQSAVAVLNDIAWTGMSETTTTTAGA